ncbi:hypothetical protein CERSUDRAFT_112634 [Gelatoporia subvermispora B]|uniref:DNA replication checkpoint mediator MRC1 domain-containing protein n=1 Tax=Ceriporiopsis subvermispora (strain B) TaxID=914234 RepID=M2RJH5_CERS8|nr:hypothetical protein CERSUDRAFT_112634 [Gelatoporia subvermispora B]
MKRPSKKEQIEAQKAASRSAAELPVSVPRDQSGHMTVDSLWATLHKSVMNKEAETAAVQMSDPIMPFSSSPLEFRSTERSRDEFIPTGLLAPSAGDDGQKSGSSDDADSPDVSPTARLQNKGGGDGQRKQLHELKRRVLEQQLQQRLKFEALADDEDDEDDLVIVQPDMQSVAKEEARTRRTLKHDSTSKGKLKQLAFAGRTKKPTPSTSASTVRSSVKGKEPEIIATSYGELNKTLMQRAHAQSSKAIEAKEEEWRRMGGRIQRSTDTSGNRHKDAVLALISKGMSASSDTGNAAADPAEDSESDEDWAPDQDEQQALGEFDFMREEFFASGGENTDDAHTAPGESSYESTDNADDEEREGEPDEYEENEEEEVIMPSRPARTYGRKIAVIQSDEEEDEEEIILPPRPARTYGRKATVLRPDEEEDQEEVIMPPRPARTYGRKATVLRPDEEDHLRSGDAGDASPLQDAFSSPLAAPALRDALSSPLAAPALRDALSSPPAASAGLRTGGLSQFFTQYQSAAVQNRIQGLGDDNEFSLTLDVEPPFALEVPQDVRQRAEIIFAKEQELLVETSGEGGAPSPKLYVNEHGFLTQSLAVSSPDISRMPFGTEFSSSTPSSPIKNSARPLSLHRQALEPVRKKRKLEDGRLEEIGSALDDSDREKSPPEELQFSLTPD